MEETESQTFVLLEEKASPFPLAVVSLQMSPVPPVCPVGSSALNHAEPDCRTAWVGGDLGDVDSTTNGFHHGCFVAVQPRLELLFPFLVAQRGCALFLIADCLQTFRSSALQQGRFPGSSRGAFHCWVGQERLCFRKRRWEDPQEKMLFCRNLLQLREIWGPIAAAWLFALVSPSFLAEAFQAAPPQRAPSEMAPLGWTKLGQSLKPNRELRRGDARTPLQPH